MAISSNSGRLPPGAPPAGPWAVACAGAYTLDPAAPYLPDALILCEGERIIAVGPRSRLAADAAGPVHDLGRAVLAPGLVNAHVHLALSHTAGRTELGRGFLAWLRSLVPLLRESPGSALLARTAAGLAADGTAVVGDICDRWIDKVLEALALAGVEAHCQLEFLGFASNVALDWPSAVAAIPERALNVSGHALYSTRDTILKAAHAWAAAEGRVFSIHLAESPEELDFCLTGHGPLAELFRQYGLLPGDYRPPGLRPVAWAESLGLLGPGTLAVHCVHVNASEVARLAATQTSVCLCPRSNASIHVGRAPWEAFLESGARVCLGTDGLSSNTDLSLWNELRHFRAHCRKSLDLSAALALVSANPAAALGLAERYGAIAPDRRAVFAVVPEDILAWGEATGARAASWPAVS